MAKNVSDEFDTEANPSQELVDSGNSYVKRVEDIKNLGAWGLLKIAIQRRFLGLGK